MDIKTQPQRRKTVEKTETENKTSGSGFLSGLFVVIAVLALMAFLLGILLGAISVILWSPVIVLVALWLGTIFTPKSASEEDEVGCGESTASRPAKKTEASIAATFCSHCDAEFIDVGRGNCGNCGAPRVKT